MPGQGEDALSGEISLHKCLGGQKREWERSKPMQGKQRDPAQAGKGRAKAGELLWLGARPLGARTCSPAVPGAQARLGPCPMSLSFIMEMPFLRSQEGDPFHHLAIFGHHRLLKSQGSTRIQSPSGFFWSFRKQVCQVG